MKAVIGCVDVIGRVALSLVKTLALFIKSHFLKMLFDLNSALSDIKVETSALY